MSMLKKTITYTDYNGNERTENFYFNINESELMDMEMGTTGGYREMLKLLSEKQDIPKIIKEIKRLILTSYGEKSLDGREFRKSEELSNAFLHTEAYNKLYMELLSNAEATAAFINGVFPEKISGVEDDEAVLTKMPKEDNVSILHPEVVTPPVQH